MKKTMIFKIFIILLAFFAGFKTLSESKGINIINLDSNSNINSKLTTTSIEVNNEYLDVTVNDTLTLDLSITNPDLSIKSYKSLNTYILSVSDKGVVYGKHKGTTGVMVTLSDNSSKTININVCDNPESVEIYSSDDVLLQGETSKIVASVLPIGSNRNVTYQSSNDNVEVKEDGSIVVSSKASGSVTITATTKNGLNDSKDFTILPKSSCTKSTTLNETSAVSINQSDIDTYNSIDLYCGVGATSFTSAPIYYVELNDISYTSSEEGSSVITILAKGYVNIVFKVNGHVSLIGKNYLGIQVTSNSSSDDPHANIIFESNDLKSSISIGYTDTLSTEDESGLGNATFSLKDNNQTSIDITTLTDTINSLSGTNQSVNFYLVNNLYKTVNFSDSQSLYGYVSDTVDINYSLNETDIDIISLANSSETSVANIDSSSSIPTLKLNSLGESLITITTEDYPYIYDYIIFNVYEDNLDELAIDDITTKYGTNELIKDETYTLNVSSSNYIIESSDENVLHVNDDLTITAITCGNASLTVYYKNNTLISKTKDYKVIVAETKIEYTNGLYDNYPLYINNTFDLSKYLLVTPEDATYKTLTYSSSDSSIISVDETGLINALKEGSSTITVTSKGGVKIEVSFNVLIPVSEISCDITDRHQIERGSSYDLSAHITVLPANASNKEVEYLSSDESIATVDETGLITTLAKDNFSITVTSKDSDLISKTIYFISYVSVKSIDISSLEGQKTIYDKGTLDLKNLVKVLPVDATNTNITFESSNSDILTVNENGLVEALSSGKAVITIKASDDVSASIEIESYIKVTSIDVALDDTKIEKGSTLDLASLITIAPIDATNKTLTYTSSNSSIISIDDKGLITGLAQGKSTITIHQADIEKEITLDCVVSVTGIEKVNESTLSSRIEKGETLDIKNYFNVLPLDATNKNVLYTIDDTSIATVSDDGIISSINKGHFTLTITTVDGAYSTNFELEVYVTVKDIYVEVPETHVFKVNETYQIKAHVLPVDANVQTINYYTATNKATVNSNGLVTFVEIGNDNGEVKITIRSSESSIEKTLTLYVVQPVSNIVINTEDKVVLPVGETLNLNYTIYPTNASNKEVKYSSSNTSIASINESGLITSLSIGEVVISVETLDGSFKDSITLYCGPHVESIKIENSETIVKVGDSIQIKVSISPIDAANSKFTYSTSNSDIASITEDGLLTAHRTGQVRITVTTIDLGKVSNITLNVKNVQDKPSEIESSNVLIYNNSIVIMNPLSTVEYRLLDSNSNVVYDWRQELTNNKIIFDDLSDNTNYTIEYRTIGTAYKDASEALALSVKTEKNEFVKLNTGLIVLMFILGALVLGLIIFFIIKGLKKKKKNA